MSDMGRPTKYKPEFCEQVIEIMMEGASFSEVAADLGICKDTLYRWQKEKPDFSDACKKGLDLSEAWWMRNGRTNLQNKEFNYTGWYMNMKNRHGWKDRSTQEQVGEGGGPVKTEHTWNINVRKAKAPAKGDDK